MSIVNLKGVGYQTLNNLSGFLKNKTNDPVGVYVLAPYFMPYYVGMSTSKLGIFKEINSHIRKFKDPNQCKYVIFNQSFYFDSEYGRNQILPRSNNPTKPSIFLSNAKGNVIFWRENVGFMNPNDLINPLDRTLPLSNLKDSLKHEVLDVVNEVFSMKNFRFFYFELMENDLKNDSLFLESLETVVKFSLRLNTVSNSRTLNTASTRFKKYGVSKINIYCPNQTIKDLFYPFPHDGNHNPVANLQGIVNII